MIVKFARCVIRESIRYFGAHVINRKRSAEKACVFCHSYINHICRTAVNEISIDVYFHIVHAVNIAVILHRIVEIQFRHQIGNVFGVKVFAAVILQLQAIQ